MQGSTCFDIDVHYRPNPKPVFEACNPYESLTEQHEYGYRWLAVVKSPNTIRDSRWTKSIVWVKFTSGQHQRFVKCIWMGFECAGLLFQSTIDSNVNSSVDKKTCQWWTFVEGCLSSIYLQERRLGQMEGDAWSDIAQRSATSNDTSVRWRISSSRSRRK